MKEAKIKLSTIEDVKNFVSLVTGFDSDIDLASGKYIVDAKSIMGIFSLDLLNPIQLTADGKDEDEVIKALSKFICE